MIKLFKILFAFILLLLTFPGHAQVITLGSGSFTGSNFAGPCNTSTVSGAHSRYAYIFPASLLTSLKDGDSIRSISFMRNAGGSISGGANMKIYIRTTVNSDYGSKSVNWANLTGATGMKKVYDSDPTSDIGGTSGWVRFTFSAPYVVDTVLGKNLEVLVEYRQNSSQSSDIFWNFENSATVTGYQTNQTKFARVNGGTIADTTNFSSELHPSMRIEFPRTDFDLSVGRIYSLGKLPVPLGNPDTVKVIIGNVGKKPNQNFKVYFRSKGANDLIDSGTYTLDYLEEKLIVLPLLTPTSTGLDTLEVTTGPDGDSSNNASSTLRLATDYIYSYKDPARPIAGGIGFNGSTGDFVAKFYSNSQKAINQVSVSFAGTTQKFKLGIWAADGVGGKPKTNIWTSDTLQSAPNFITPILPPVSVNGPFYIGVRQIGTTNVAFGYQPELPVRPNTFYYTAPTGDTNWVDFAPDAPFKFVIEPRIQANKDMAPIRFEFPRDTIKLMDVVTMAPKATILNYGADDAVTPFNIKVNIHRNNYLEYTSTKQDTLYSGGKRLITFDSTFLPTLAGDYIVTVITALPGDQMKDNDTLRYKFIVAAFKDVGPGMVFDPTPSFDYEQFVDTIYPTVYIQNYGLDNQGPFTVTALIFDSTKTLIYSDVKSYSLTALNSVLASFKPFPCSVKGNYYFTAFTSLGVDVDLTNDTVRRTFRIVRSNDVGVTSVDYPANNQALGYPVPANQPFVTVENMGDLNQADPFKVHARIYYKDSLIYADSVTTNSFRTIPSTVIFKNFKPVQKGYYRMVSFTDLYNDQYRKNDTLISVFAVGVPDDVEVLAISPAAGSVLQVNTVYPTSVTVRNNGYNRQNSPFPLAFKVTRGQSITYVKVINITLDSGETKTFVIDTSLVLPYDSVYQVTAYTMLQKDFVRSNDTLKGIYGAAKAYDVGVTAVLYPLPSDTLLIGTQNVEPRVRVENLGDSMVASGFRTTIKIMLASNNAVIYQKSIDTGFAGTAGLLDLTFPGFSLSGSSQDIKIKAYTELITDQFRLNDTSNGTGRFMLLKDAVAVAIVNPLNNFTYTRSDAGITPSVRLLNQGIKPIASLYARLLIKYVDTVTTAETEVYRDSTILSNLGASETRVVNMTMPLTFSDKNTGVYKSYLSIVTPDDQNGLNNLLQNGFRIDKGIGIDDIATTVARIYPNPADDVIRVDFSRQVDGGYRMDISDIQGRTVLSGRLSGSSEWISVSHLSSGTYFLKIDQQVIKIIVQH